MDMHANIVSVAQLITEPARAAMLIALADGRAHSAGELAFVAGVTAQTASSHLGKLLTGHLLIVERQGRHRYYRLADTHVALALEHLATIGSVSAVQNKLLSREALSLQFARCCYDHLAGKVGVAVMQALQIRGYLIATADNQFDVTPEGLAWFSQMGMNVHMLKPTRRGLARQCLDWTERQHHLAGPLGVQLMALLCKKGWLRRLKGSRAVQVTPPGWTGLKEQLGIDPSTL